MPVISTTAYFSGRSVTALARSLLNDQAFNGSPVVIGTIQRATNVVTVVTNTPHGLVTGDTTTISGVSTTSFNATVIVTYVDSFTFTYAQMAADAGPIANSGQSAGQYDSGGIGLGALFNDPFLIPYTNSAYRKLQRALAMTGTATFRVDDVFLTVAGVSTPDPSVQVVISDATAPPNQLPPDLLEPLKLWERQAGSSDNFSPMQDDTYQGGLPSRTQSGALLEWEWRQDELCFVGALSDVEIRLRYRASLSDIVDGTSTILIRNSQDCLAYYTAAMAAGARGSPQAEQWASAAEDALENLISGATRQQQDRPRRRRAYGYNQGGRGWRL